MALITSPNQIPGLYCQPTLADLQNSTDRYNNLTDSEELQSEVSTRHLQNLAEIFVKYNVHNRLGVHLIHSHAKVAASHVMLGHKFTDPSGCWSRPTTIEEGKASDLSNISTGFFEQLAGYVRDNGLEEIVGLQIRGPAAENMVEFDFGDCGTVMLKAQETRYETPFRTTGWVFSCNNGVISFKGKESHAPTRQGPHKVFIDGKLAPDVPALKAILRRFNAIG